MPNLVAVRVKRWCAPEPRARTCLEIILDDVGEMDAALASPLPFTSRALFLEVDAQAFVDCVNAGGGDAAIAR
jgi:hypothetical protein